MAFSAAEKARILFYLGYSGFEDDGPAMRAVNSMDSKEATMGPMIRDILDKLEQIDLQIMETMPLAKAIQDGTIQLRAHYTMDHLWRMGRQLVSRMARWTKISVSGDVYSTGGSERSDDFQGADPNGRRSQGISQSLPSCGGVPGSNYFK